MKQNADDDARKAELAAKYKVCEGCNRPHPTSEDLERIQAKGPNKDSIEEMLQLLKDHIDCLRLWAPEEHASDLEENIHEQWSW